MHPVTEHLTCGVYDRHDAVHGHDRSGHAFTDLTLPSTGRQELFEASRPGTPLDVVSCFFKRPRWLNQSARREDTDIPALMVCHR